MNSPSYLRPCFSVLLPTLGAGRYVEVNLDQLIQAEAACNASYDRRDPFQNTALIERFHREQQVEFSYGGWMEDRSFTFKGTYMERDKRFVHLGVDVNLPVGTPISFPGIGRVLRVSTSTDMEVGWGTRVDIAHHTLPLVFLIGHLAPSTMVKSGDLLTDAPRLIGTIGNQKENGGCDPHMHLQTMDRTRYEHLVDTDLDGYGRIEDRARLEWQYPNPLESLQLLL